MIIVPIPVGEIARIPDLAGFGEAEIAGRVRRLAHLARTEVVRLAKQRLHTSQAKYVKGIQPVEFRVMSGHATGVIYLTGAFPNMVEDGVDPYDLRKTLLKPGGKVRRSAKGHMYRAIPFRHAGPTSSGRQTAAVGQAYTSEGQRETSRAFRGRMTQAEARTMGRAVWRRAQKLAPTTGTPGGRVQYGGQLDTDGIAGASETLRARHAAPIYQGMIRQQKTYEKATQSTYMTFRMISNNPDTVREDDGGRNWMHPGIEARGLFKAADEYVQRIAGAILLGQS